MPNKSMLTVDQGPAWTLPHQIHLPTNKGHVTNVSIWIRIRLVYEPVQWIQTGLDKMQDLRDSFSHHKKENNFSYSNSHALVFFIFLTFKYIFAFQKILNLISSFTPNFV